eukprot:6760252-Alexandrium_andersonii.AAC.1
MARDSDCNGIHGHWTYPVFVRRRTQFSRPAAFSRSLGFGRLWRRRADCGADDQRRAVHG